MIIMKTRNYRERLLDLRRQLVGDMQRALEAIPEEIHPPGEHDIAPSEGVDVEISLERQDEAELRDIDAALQRIKEGSFGKCVSCGVEIPAARLGAVPYATHCVRCEKQLDETVR